MKTLQDLDNDQLAAIDFIGDGEDSLLCADVGTGKTVIALTAAKLALATDKVKRWIVFAPLLVATDTWANESDEWEHLDPNDVAIACGDEKQRLDAINSDARIVVMNYENMAWFVGLYDDHFPFDGIIFDEIDKLKSVSSNRFKSLRNKIGRFRKRVGLTGTLLPNNLLEVWGQVYMVDGGQSFGRSFYTWRQKFFYPIDFKQYQWRPFERSRQEIIDTISDLTVRLKAKGLPKVVPTKPVLLDMPPDLREIYDELEKEYFLVVRDKRGLEREIDVANSAVLVGKLQQVCAGFSYVDGGKDAVWHSTAKFDWLDDLLYRIPEQMLIFYHYKEELAMLKSRMPDIPHLSGFTPRQAKRIIQDWNDGKLPFLALHPASAGHGLNLQKSNARDIAFLTWPWSGGLYKQVVGRLARRGNKAKQIMIHTALFENTMDEQVFNAVTHKMTGLEEFLDDLEIATGKVA